MPDFTAIIPYFNGDNTIIELLQSIPPDVPVLLIDDLSDTPAPAQLVESFPNLAIARPDEKGYFTGACNRGMEMCNTDVLILNQDAVLEGEDWRKVLDEKSGQYGLIGEGIAGVHPAFPKGYIHGTFLYIRRDVIQTIGLMNAVDYPLWGSTCEYQLRACRAGFEALPMRPMPGLRHDRGGRFGSSITTILQRQPDKKSLFIRTPPEISVIIPCFNYGRYLPDLVHSLIGGPTCLGEFPAPTFASFEVVIVNDASTDNTRAVMAELCDPWKGIHAVHLTRNRGTAAAINAGVQASHGKFITIMGADDMREPWALEAMYRVALQKPHHYVYDQIVAFAHGQRRPDINIRVGKFNPVDLVHKNHVHAGIMMPRQAWNEVGGYPESMGDGREDWAMNVGLLAHGWCGVFVETSGYLYRREKQNRTLKNTSQEHWRNFKAKIAQMYPQLYDGSVDLMACCGGRGAKPAPRVPSGTQKKFKVAGGEGLTILRYQGRAELKQTFYGPVTGAQYAAGRSFPLVAVDNRDLYGPNQKRVGMLERIEHGINIFVREPVAVAPKPIPQMQTVEESQEQVIQAIIGDEPKPEPADTMVVDWRDSVTDPTDLSLTEIKKLTLEPEDWTVLADKEKLGKNRKTVIAYAESKAAEIACDDPDGNCDQCGG